MITYKGSIDESLDLGDQGLILFSKTGEIVSISKYFQFQLLKAQRIDGETGERYGEFIDMIQITDTLNANHNLEGDVWQFDESEFDLQQLLNDLIEYKVKNKDLITLG